MFWPCKNWNVQYISVAHGNRYWARVKGDWGPILSAGIRIFRTAHSNKIKFDYALRSAVLVRSFVSAEMLLYACLKSLKRAQPNWSGYVADLPHRSRRFFDSYTVLFIDSFGVQHRLLPTKWSWSVVDL